MEGSQIQAVATIVFARASDAERRVAGVAAVARRVRGVAEAGFAAVWVILPEGESIGAAATEDVRRLAGKLEVKFGKPDPGLAVVAMPSDWLECAGGTIDLTGPDASAEVLRATGKPSDGPVSRWLNRPISRRISALLLRFAWVRPFHASAGTGVLAVLMFAAFVAGGSAGLLAGGMLFQAASVFDGVDGEIARATFRASRAGAVLDSLIDAATNALMLVGVTINLAQAGHDRAIMLGAWGLALFVVGQGLIAWRTTRMNAPVGFELLKHHYRQRMTGPILSALMRFLTVVSSRDFFALLFAVLILAGWPMGVLYIFATAATIWIVFVFASLLAPLDARLAADLG
jgi:CDP-L-myo-inositol myo-inositolphosphotransferase